MRKLAILFFAILIGTTATAQDSLNVSKVSSLLNGWRDAQSVDAVGSYAYVTTTYSGLKIVDVSNPSAPVAVGSFFSGEYGYEVEVTGEYAYFANSDDGVHILDVSDPANPVQVGICSTSDQARGVTVTGDYAYIADHYAGLRIFDISDPASPFEVGFCSTPDHASKVAVSGSYAIVADWMGGLKIIDVSDPSIPVCISTFQTPSDALDVFISNDLAYVASQSTGLHIIDISDPYNPYQVGFYDTSGNVKSLDFVNEFVYITNGNGISVINVSNPALPFEVGFCESPDFAQGVSVQGDYAYVADWEKGMRVVDVANPYNPIEISFIDPGMIYDVVYSDNYAFLANGDTGLCIIDLSDALHPFVVSTFHTSVETKKITVANEYVYIADSGLRVIDISNIEIPTEVGFLETDHTPRDLAFENNYIYASAGNYILIIDVSNPNQPTLVADYYLQWLSANAVFATGDYIYIVENWADYYSYMLVLDVSNPLIPQEVCSYYLSEEIPKDIFVSGNYAYIAVESTGMRVFDITNPALPFEVDWIDTDNAVSVYISGNYAFLAAGGSGLRVIDISDPYNLDEVGYYDTEGYSYGVTVHNGYAGIADYYSFSIFDCTEATPPSLIDVILIPPQQLVIPRGGSFQYDALLMSNLPAPTRVDIWTFVVQPNGNPYGPILRILGFPFTPNTIIEANAITQYVPIGAPLGMYTYHLNAGRFPRRIAEGDQFSFEVVETLNAEGDQQSTWSAWGYEQAFGRNTGIRLNGLELPDEFDLLEAYPNPFNPSTNLTVELPAQTDLTVIVYNINGQQVAELVNGSYPAGSHTLTFDGSDQASGLYFVRATAPGHFDQVQKVALVK